MGGVVSVRKASLAGGLAVCTSLLCHRVLYLEHKCKQLEDAIAAVAVEPTPAVKAVVDPPTPEVKVAAGRPGPSFVMEEIGCIRSNFPHKAGTPRQGTLAPHARSHLVLHSTVPAEALDALTEYSHLWVVFRFHINVVSEQKQKKQKQQQVQVQRSSRYMAKVKPPRAGGAKVGVFSTRSPHRPNPVGLSLCMIERVDMKSRTLHLLGLDLVDGTPVYDIKPYVPYDAVGLDSTPPLRVPGWVSSSDTEFAAVSFSEEVVEAVAEARRNGSLAPLYPPLDGGVGVGPPAAACEVCQAIAEVVAQDPRTLRDGRGTSAVSSYHISFSTLRITFEVHKESKDSGDISSQRAVAVIVAAVPDPGDPEAPVGSYQHSMALRRAAEEEAQRLDRPPIRWRYPVREGVTEGLFLKKR